MKFLIIVLIILISPMANAIITPQPINWSKPPSNVYVNISNNNYAALVLSCNGLQELGIYIGLPRRIIRNMKIGSVEELKFTFSNINGKTSKHTIMFRVNQNKTLFRKSTVPALLNSIAMMKEYDTVIISYQWFSQDFSLEANRNTIAIVEKDCTLSKTKNR